MSDKMNIITHNTISNLKKTFIGSPPIACHNLNLIPASVPDIAIICNNNRTYFNNNEIIFDFGVVPSIGNTSKIIKIKNTGDDDVDLYLNGSNEWLDCCFENNEQYAYLLPQKNSIDLLLNYVGNGQDFNSSTNLILTAKSNNNVQKQIEIKIIVNANKNFPYGIYNFNGKQEQCFYDFEQIHPFEKLPDNKIYNFYIINIGKKSLKLIIENIPQWLIIEPSNSQETNNEKFFFEIMPEKKLSFDIKPLISPKLIGAFYDTIHFITNDLKDEYRQFNLSFKMEQFVDGPYIICDIPETKEVFNDYKAVLNLRNYGNKPAYVSANIYNNEIVNDIVPDVCNNLPGEKEISVIINNIMNKIEPGKHIIPLSLVVKDSKQKEINIPLTIKPITIEYEPKIINFGTINPPKAPEIIIKFKACDKRELFIELKCYEQLKNNIKITRINKEKFNIKLVNAIKNRVIEFDGPGLTFYNNSYGFFKDLNIYFKRLTPEIEIPQNIIDFGEIVGGQTISGTFEIKNKGNGNLECKLIKPDAYSFDDDFTINDNLSIKGSLFYVIEPGETQYIEFTINCCFDIYKIFKYEQYITIETNEPKDNFEYIIKIKAYILEPAGKLCQSCNSILDIEHLFCVNCSCEIKNIDLIAKKDILICPKCNRMYYNCVKYCMKDGKELINP